MNTWRVIGLAVGMISLTACSLDRAVDVENPDIARVKDPEFVKSRAGALQVYYGAVQNLQLAFSEKSLRVGLMTDELTSTMTNGFWTAGDSRTESILSRFVYGLDATPEYMYAHDTRKSASQARTLLRALGDSSLNALIAGAYALEGYGIVALAEDYCSGVPLTEVPFGGDIVYGSALSTPQLFTRAIALFDSALAMSHDSVSLRTLARIGLGRAYLGLGDYDAAVQAVSDVQPTDSFVLTYTQAADPTGGIRSGFWTALSTTGTSPVSQVEIVNHEGENGMVWYSDPATLDPRVRVTTTTAEGVAAFPTIVQQQKFVTGTVTFPLARWVDAQLIQAEAMLQHGDPTWIQRLNEARATVGLDVLTDPGTVAGRVDLLFRERAFWHYLAGERLADFRRLVRQYGRTPETVYPTGIYTRPGSPVYGTAWVFVVPKAEMENNYRYDGCEHTRP